MTEFKPFPSITRFYEQNVVITEKIDGTNGLVFIEEDGVTIRAGSRSRWVTPDDDNFGFARWVSSNAESLLKLGPGYHYGEWWGQGIQRKYGMDKKVFSLFNVDRWKDDDVRPDCCDVVPVLYNGHLTASVIEQFMSPMPMSLSAWRYGIEFKKPEVTMFYFTKARVYFKVPLDK